MHVAERSLYINIARCLWGFNISKEIGSDGAVVEPETEMVRGFLSVPKPFKAKITVRSEKHAAVIREDMKNAKLGGNSQ